MRAIYLLIMLGLFAFSCSNPSKNSNQEAQSQENNVEIYEAQIQPLNSNITNLQTSGKARFVIDEDKMHVTIDINNAPPGIEHWQHFHGFPNEGIAQGIAICATEVDDANEDGIIDVVETETVSGTTMVPFNKFPAEMEIPTDTYPVADDNGSYHYEIEIPLNDLESAFADAFGGSGLKLDSRVLYIHGVPADTDLPETVASIGDIPA
ncbi:MAG TPA: hypothetical protein VLZ33_01205, partial [Dysgonamonadaceae bacterium]|nr:hypothetical protein [Dysgonamonadaceae bacterium]